MNTPLPIRAKLITAALSLVLACTFSTLHDISSRSPGEVAFRVGCVVFSVVLAFGGVFGNVPLQLLWGWGLAVAAPVLIALCVFVFRGSDFIWGFISMLAATVGSYLLLVDSSVRDYRASIKR